MAMCHLHRVLFILTKISFNTSPARLEIVQLGLHFLFFFTVIVSFLSKLTFSPAQPNLSDLLLCNTRFLLRSALFHPPARNYAALTNYPAYYWPCRIYARVTSTQRKRQSAHFSFLQPLLPSNRTMSQYKARYGHQRGSRCCETEKERGQ